jgi:hypothetical protein
MRRYILFAVGEVLAGQTFVSTPNKGVSQTTGGVLLVPSDTQEAAEKQAVNSDSFNGQS